MKYVQKPYLLLIVLLAIALATWPIWSNITTSGRAFFLGIVSMSKQEQDKPAKDPCRFMTLKDKSIPYEESERRQDMEIYGYPTETPLTEAIRMFNEQKQCSGLYAQYPPLTEDELIAAIVAGPDYGKQGEIWLAQKDVLWKIASEKVMPKGSLLFVESGGRVVESPLRPFGTVAAKGIRITLLLGLDKSNDPGRILKPEQTLIIRKTYSKVETIR
ncbi:MAG TPA: hypothetical protein VK421_07515 [Pyrinomonadaceae bacterium]|nr:hypothetical protein [Pyrinomonadaceae bacterium]